MAPAARLSYVGTKATFALALGLLPALLFGLYSIATGADAGRGALLGLALGGTLLSLGLRLALLAGDIRRSRIRMSDPMYRAKLVRFEMRAR